MSTSTLLGAGTTLKAAAAGGYTAQGVRFDGSTWFATAGPLTGSTNGQKFTVSFWYQMRGGDSTYGMLFEPSTQIGLYVDRYNNNNWWAVGFESTGVNQLAVGQADANAVVDGTWHHIFASCDSSGAPGTFVNNIYYDGAQLGVGHWSSNNSIGTSLINFTGTGPISLGARYGGSLFLNADIADLWIAYNICLDPTTNITKFRNASTGKPVDLGSTGSIPTGTAPIAFFSGAVANWHKNKGTGGDLFTLQAGSGLTASSTNP